jgi:hypothetical protein
MHLEFCDNQLDYPVPDGTDVVVLAGDISTGRQGVIWAKENFDVPVVMVAGNHEAYGRNWKIPKLYEILRDECKGSNVHFLQNDSVEIDGVLFAGTTLWTDFDLEGRGPLVALQAQTAMNDYRTIRYGKEGERDFPFTPTNAISEHLLAKNFLSSIPEGAVVVTHHAPSGISIPDRFIGDPLNACYANRMENFMMQINPVVWFHGHIHDSSDYQIGDTRVVANPRGYPGHEMNPTFDPKLLIEI